MKKLLSFLFVFVILFLLYSEGKRAFIKARSSARKLQEEQILEDDTKYSIVEKKEKEQTIEGVYVPYYWKTGVPAENSDYLKGYIPNIKDFVEYIKVKDSVLYGSSPSVDEVFDYRSVSYLLEPSNVVFADGIQNAHSYFNWDKENCVIIEEGYLKERIFVCDNWVNWLKHSKKAPLFVLTDCYIEGMSGKCLFSDYTKVFFNKKKVTENRCLSLGQLDFCDWNKYIKLIKYK